MKCIIHLETGKISRVSDTIARSRVGPTDVLSKYDFVPLSGYEYVPKSRWKEQVRDVVVPETPIVETVTVTPEKGERAPQKRRSRSDRRRGRQSFSPGGRK